MSDLIIGGPLLFSEPDCPTREGEVVDTLEDIYNIPSPRVGMRVFVKDTKKSYIVTKLKEEEINGVLVPNAKVNEFEDSQPDVAGMNDAIQANANAIADEVTRAKSEEKSLGSRVNSLRSQTYDIIANLGSLTSGNIGLPRVEGNPKTANVHVNDLSIQEYVFYATVAEEVNDDITFELVKDNAVIQYLGVLPAGEFDFEANVDIKSEITNVKLRITLPVAKENSFVNINYTLMPVKTIAETIAELSDKIDNIPTGEIADGSVTEQKLSPNVKNKLNTAYDKATLADTLISNFNNIKPKIGAVNNDGTIYYGTSFCSHIALTGEGILSLNDGYFIDKVLFLVKDGSVIDIYGENLNITSLEFGDDTMSWLIEFRKSDNTTFNNNDLEKVIKNVSFNSVAWNEYSNLDNYNCTGEYVIRGERKNNDDNMPINNLGNIEARLNVIADTIGKNATQVLTLLNVGGGDGNIYTRTRQDNTWGAWGKLQTNIEVGVINQQQMDALVDNGIYSGILSTTGETFVLVVINNYAIATQAGYGGYISHLKYSVGLDGVVKVETRRRDAFGSWTDWQSIGGSKPSELLVPSEWQGKLSTLSDGVHEFYGDCSFGKSGTLWGWADSCRYNTGEPTYIKLIKKGQDTALAQAIGTAASATRMINIQTETLL